MEPLTIRFSLEPSELAAAWSQHLPTVGIQRRRMYVVVALLSLVGLLLALRSPLYLLVPAAAIAVAVFAPSLQRRQLIAATSAPAFTDDAVVTLDENGTQIDTRLSRLWYAWENYEAVVEDDAGVGLVARGGVTLRWIPSRAFESIEQRSAWVGHIRRRMELAE